jgi:hypothetical protein
MLWNMLQELGCEKQPKYFGMQLMYESSELVWHVQVYIFTSKPLRQVFEVDKIHAAIAPKHTFDTRIHDVAHQAYMVTRLHQHQLLEVTEYAHFPHHASGSTYIHVEPVPDSRGFQ